MRTVPNWPFRCPQEGWYLSKVDAIFAKDLDLSYADSGDPRVPLLIYGDCKRHGRRWLTDTKYYQPEVWDADESP